MARYKDYFLPLKDKVKEKDLCDQLVNLCMDFYSGKARGYKFLQYKSSEELKNLVSEQLPQNGFGIEKMMKVLEDPIGKYSIAQFDKDYFAFPDSGNAINLGRSNTDDAVVVYGDADCVFDELAIAKIVRELSDTDQYVVVGGLDVPNFKNSDPTSILCEFQKIMQIERIARGRVLTIGRLIGFDQNKIPEPFPINVHSEDIWIALQAAKKYKFKAVKILLDAKVYYQPPLTWNDFLAQETRYEMSMDQLFDKFPELHSVYNNHREPFTSEIRNQIEHTVQMELVKLGISQERRFLLHSVFDKVVEENAKYYLEGFMKGNGDWKPVSTTK